MRIQTSNRGFWLLDSKSCNNDYFKPNVRVHDLCSTDLSICVVEVLWKIDARGGDSRMMLLSALSIDTLCVIFSMGRVLVLLVVELSVVVSVF